MFPHKRENVTTDLLQREITGAVCTGRSHYVPSCSPFFKRKSQLEKDVFQSMTRHCMNIKCLRYLPTKQKPLQWGSVPMSRWRNTDTAALVSRQPLVFIPKGHHLYETLRWSGADSDSCARGCYGGLQDAGKIKLLFWAHCAEGKRLPRSRRFISEEKN